MSVDYDCPGGNVDVRLEKCIKRGCPYGNAKWIETAAKKLGLETTLRPRGRPKEVPRHLHLTSVPLVDLQKASGVFKETKARWRRSMDPKCGKKRLVRVFVFVVFVAILFNGNFLAYLAGRLNSFWLVRAVVLLWIPMVVLGAISLIAPLRFLCQGIRQARSTVLPLYIVAASTVIIFVGSFCAYDQWWVRHTCGLRDRMMGILTVEKVDRVRTWLAELPDGGNFYPQEIESHDFPLPAKDFKFASVYLSLEEVQGASVRVVVLSWGGGFLGPWGVTIGPQDMERPVNTKHRYTLSVSPGVFVRHNVG